MKFLKYFIIIFISLTTSIKADLNKNLINQLEDGGKLIFIRHAFAPGNGDPNNFNLNDCSTQRNLNSLGRKQAKNIGEFFRENKIKIYKVLSSEWCRCKETADIAFKDYSTNSFLNSFYSSKYAKNKDKQVEALNNYVKKINSNGNLISRSYPFSWVIINCLNRLAIFIILHRDEFWFNTSHTYVSQILCFLHGSF